AGEKERAEKRTGPRAILLGMNVVGMRVARAGVVEVCGGLGRIFLDSDPVPVRSADVDATGQIRRLAARPLAPLLVERERTLEIFLDTGASLVVMAEVRACGRAARLTGFLVGRDGPGEIAPHPAAVFRHEADVVAAAGIAELTSPFVERRRLRVVPGDEPADRVEEREVRAPGAASEVTGPPEHLQRLGGSVGPIREVDPAVGAAFGRPGRAGPAVDVESVLVIAGPVPRPEQPGSAEAPGGDVLRAELFVERQLGDRLQLLLDGLSGAEHRHGDARAGTAERLLDEVALVGDSLVPDDL